MRGWPYGIAVGLLLGGILGAALLLTRPLPAVSATNIERLPLQIDGYSGSDDSFGEGIYAALNADMNLFRHYRSGATRIDLYIGYYGTARGGRSAHNPGACLPGAGWAIVDSRVVGLAGEEGGAARPVRMLTAQKDGYFVTLYHWYQVNGAEIAGDGIRQNLLRFKNRLLYNRDDGAFVQITLFSDREGLDDARREGRDFALQVSRMLPEVWPEESGIARVRGVDS